MAIWPWASRWENQQQDIDRFPHMKAWLDRVWARPAVQAGRAIGKENRMDLASDREAQKILFNQSARD
jgi:GST-like protein